MNTQHSIQDLELSSEANESVAGGAAVTGLSVDYLRTKRFVQAASIVRKRDVQVGVIA